MGVQGLLPMLKSVMDQVNIAKYKGKTAGIDAAGWLYKGCYSCAQDVVMGKDTDGYLNFCLQQIKLLQEHDIRPMFVFDGAPLPAKAELNRTRYRTREMWRQKALGELEANSESRIGAFNKAVSVSNSMIMKFIGILRNMDIQFIVAPYEADAQLAYLSKLKIVDVVISEDSDCIPYGCRTVLFKWNADGWASELKRRSLGANEDLSFVGWTDEMFVQLCVLCGCDYCPSVPGVGIITAYKLVNVHKKPLEVVEALKEQKGSGVPSNYPELFYSAVLTFRHHLVFDPRDEKLKMLNPLNVSGDLPQMVDKELGFLGNLELKDDVAASIAHGLVHPVTHESYAWKETAELQSLGFPEDGSLKSMTSSETSSCNSGNNHPPDLLERLASSGICSSRVVPITDDDGEIIDPRRVIQVGSTTKPPLTSWKHLHGVLGTSTHILNFRSPKVSENFRSLVTTESQRPQFHAGKTTEQLKVFENVSCRQNLKRVRNPRHRNRDDQKSGFEGEVSCRVDTNGSMYQGFSQKRKPAHTKSQEPITESVVSTSFPVELGSMEEDDIKSTPPVPFFTRNRRFGYSASLYRNGPPPQASSSSWNPESELIWSLETAKKESKTAFNAVTARRAATAEEKWDRILQEESDSQDEGSPKAKRPTTSSSNRSFVATKFTAQN